MKRALVTVFYRPLDVIFRTVTRLIGASTLGVRGIIIDDSNRVLLVKHTYIKGWYCPGGGVSRLEHPTVALARELNEEVGITLTAPPRLLDIFPLTRLGAADHWVVYEVTDYVGPVKIQDPVEIKAINWFDLELLPADLEWRTRRLLDARAASINKST